MEKNNQPLLLGIIAVLVIAVVYLMVFKSDSELGYDDLNYNDSALQVENSSVNEPVEDNITAPTTPNYMEPQIPVALTDSQKAQLQAGAEDHETKELVFDVSGGSFYFMPNEIRVKEGDKVKIIFTNVGGTHDLVLPDFGVATTITKTGESDVLEFTADKKGTFEFYCSIGNGYHRQMGQIGVLLVE
ncbi:hypothetical protein GW765_04710 [Candidatus Parcubacteria bacterium]|nr:hypothetical protein [Candidatus Parcubacteria bacterium]